MTRNISSFKPWLVLFVCWLTFGESSAWAQHVGMRHPSEGYFSSLQSEPDAEVHAKWAAAAEQGDADAQVNVGYYNDLGLYGRPDDNAAAIMWYTKAAEQGNARGQLNLGAMYTRGKGVPKDDATARMWYTKAAEQGDFHAQLNLGSIYSRGDGVPEDDAIAVMWYTKAAEQGSVWGQSSLASMYWQGHGVPEDHVIAYMWFNIVVASGYDTGADKDSKEEIGWSLTPEDLSKAQALSTKCFAQNYKNCGY